MTTVLYTSLHIFHPFAACLNCASVSWIPSALLSFSSIGTCLAIVDFGCGVRIGQGQLATYAGCCSPLLLCRNKRTSYNESSLKLARKYVRCRKVRDSVACEQALVDLSVRGTRGNTLSRDSEQLKADGRHVHLDDNVDRRTRRPRFAVAVRRNTVQSKSRYTHHPRTLSVRACDSREHRDPFVSVQPSYYHLALRWHEPKSRTLFL